MSKPFGQTFGQTKYLMMTENWRHMALFSLSESVQATRTCWGRRGASCLQVGPVTDAPRPANRSRIVASLASTRALVSP